MVDIESFDELKTEGRLITSPRSLKALRRLGYTEEQLYYKPWAWFTSMSECPEEAALRREHWLQSRNRILADVRHARQIIIQHETSAPVSTASPTSTATERTGRQLVNLTAWKAAGHVSPFAQREQNDLKKRDNLLRHIEQKSDNLTRQMDDQRKLRDEATSQRLQKWLRTREHATDMKHRRELAKISRHAILKSIRDETADKVALQRAQKALDKRAAMAEKLQLNKQRATEVFECKHQQHQAACRKTLDRSEEIEKRRRDMLLARDLVKADTDWVARQALQQKMERERTEQEDRERKAHEKHTRNERWRAGVEEERKMLSMYKHLVSVERDEKRKEARLLTMEEEHRRLENKASQREEQEAAHATDLKSQRLRQVNKELQQMDRMRSVEQAKRLNQLKIEELAQRIERKDQVYNERKTQRQREAVVFSITKHKEWVEKS